MSLQWACSCPLADNISCAINREAGTRCVRVCVCTYREWFSFCGLMCGNGPKSQVPAWRRLFVHPGFAQIRWWWDETEWISGPGQISIRVVEVKGSTLRCISSFAGGYEEKTRPISSGWHASLQVKQLTMHKTTIFKKKKIKAEV